MIILKYLILAITYLCYHYVTYKIIHKVQGTGLRMNNTKLFIDCFDWENSYNYCCTVLQNNHIQYHPNLLAALLIITKGYSNLDKHKLEQIIYGKETIANMEDNLNKCLSIYEDFFYDYQIEKIMDFLKYESVLMKLFKLESIEDVLKAFYQYNDIMLKYGIVISN